MSRITNIGLLLLALAGTASQAMAQCTDYDIIVGGGAAQGQIHWELMDQSGNIIASGDAPESTGECLPNGCYTMVMYDDGGNGWQGGTWTINYENTSIVVASGTLSAGGYGTALVDLNGNCSSSSCQDFQIDVSAGSNASEVYWELVDEFGGLMAAGGAPDSQVACLADGCYLLYLYDAGGNGWEGGAYAITDLSNGSTLAQGTLANGSFATAQVIIGAGCGACDFIDLAVTAGSAPAEVSWDLFDANGNFISSGGAATLQSLCLAPGCYTFYAYDSGNNGWNGAQYTFTDPGTGATIASGSLVAGGFGTFQVSVGGGCSTGSCSTYTMVVTAGSAPAEVSWSLSSMGTVHGSGWAPSSVTMCLDTGCYIMRLYDSAGNGWNGATWTLYNSGGSIVQSGTLASGATGAMAINLGGTGACTVPVVVTASDCPQAVNVCTNLNFTIDPNGWGAIWEIPALGSTSNPEFLWNDGILSPWGTDHYGCLMGQEINTTWMIVNIAQGGSLEFTLGANGAQAGFYDWIMFPYGSSTCGQVLANTIAPVRCNWNFASQGGTGAVNVVPPGGFPENYEPPLNVSTGQRYLICFSNWSSVTTVVPLVFGGTAVVSCTPLPIALMSFDAAPRGDVVEVRWITASEQASDHFEVQRSADEEQWSTVGIVPAAGNASTVMRYAFTDPEPLDDGSYYRLALVDADGSRRFSEAVRVELLAEPMRCHPNPTDGVTWVDNLPEGAALEVRDAMGRPVLAALSQPQANVVRIDLSGLPPGVYTVCAAVNDELRCSRVLRAAEP